MSLYKILKQYCDYYMHYNTHVLLDIQTDYGLYDICFYTADTVFEVLTKADLEKQVVPNNKIINYLQNNQVINVYLKGNHECHQLIKIYELFISYIVFRYQIQ